MFINYQINQQNIQIDDRYPNVGALISLYFEKHLNSLTINGVGNDANLTGKIGFLKLDFKAKKDFEPENFVQKLANTYSTTDFYLYVPENGHYRLVVALDEAFNLDELKQLKAQENLINLISNTLGDQGRILKKQSLDADLMLSALTQKDYAFWQTSQQHRALALKNPVTTQRSHNELYDMLKKYLDETANTLSYGKSLARLLSSLAKSKVQDRDAFIELIQNYTDVNVQALFDELKIKPLRHVPPLEQYCILSTKQRRLSLGDFLLRFTKATPDPEMELNMVIALLKRTFMWGIANDSPSFLDGLLVFDPRIGYWVNDPDLLVNLVDTLRPLSSRQDIQRVHDQLATDANNNLKTIKAYNGSRYLLFNNCVLDVVNNQELSLDSDWVKQLHFTERTHLNVDYIKDAPLPQIENERVADDDGNGHLGTWNVEDFISAYSNNDPKLRQYLLFCLSLSLFSGHNFGVTIDIQGSSGWGKTTLFEILNKLHKHSSLIPFTAINSQFPFTNYHNETGVIWLKECNTNDNELTPQGTSLYDSLCDGQVRFEIKGKNDVFLNDPPTVYVDGTALIKADDISTGPARRTLPFILPDNIDSIPENARLNQNTNEPLSLRDQLYAASIIEDLHRDDVTQYLVDQMVKAYQATVDRNFMNDLKINLASKSVLKQLDLPNNVNVWRKKFIAESNDISDWFVSSILPCIVKTNDVEQATLFQDQYLYALYQVYYRQNNPTDRNLRKIIPLAKFSKLVSQSLTEANLNTVEVGSTYNRYAKKRKRVANFNKANFAIQKYREANDVPHDYQDETNLPYPFKKATDGWYAVITAPNYNDPFDENETDDNDSDANVDSIDDVEYDNPFANV